jgi:hypothetical protein
VQEHIRRLQVTMDDPDPVDRRHGPRQLDHQLGGRTGGHRRPGQPLGKRPALEQLEREVRHAGELADLVDLHDIGVPQPRNGLGLDAKPRKLH